MMEERISKLESRVTALEKDDAVDKVHRVNVEKRLGSIEELLKYVLRTFLGGIILAILAFLLSGGFVP